MPRWPISFPIPPRVTPHGAYGYERKSKADGSCGMSGYPCRHLGIDLAAVKGTEVVAPEDLWVVSTARGTFPPFRGYGPGVILARGRSGVYHLLAHLEYESIPSPTVEESWFDALTEPLWYSDQDPRKIREGELVGVTSSANHVHWETRTGEWKGPRTNPAEWLRRFQRLDVSDYTASGGGGGALLLLGLALLGRKRRRQ